MLLSSRRITSGRPEPRHHRSHRGAHARQVAINVSSEKHSNCPGLISVTRRAYAATSKAFHPSKQRCELGAGVSLSGQGWDQVVVAQSENKRATALTCHHSTAPLHKERGVGVSGGEPRAMLPAVSAALPQVAGGYPGPARAYCQLNRDGPFRGHVGSIQKTIRPHARTPSLTS